ncbi:MAG TPA: rhodanese-like domain-containing protein [Pseudogracilibacillus sp.]|nr:rhodanese-like domain-containing protein [Pseudogracilibacillus sp.]
MSLYGVIQFGITIIFVAVILKLILPARGVKQITVEELRPYLKENNVQLLDVRPVEKYERFHIYGFDNMPVANIKKEADQLDKNKLTITICQTGAHGNRACKKLKRRGFTNLANVRGGLSTWDHIHIDRT